MICACGTLLLVLCLIWESKSASLECSVSVIAGISLISDRRVGRSSDWAGSQARRLETGLLAAWSQYVLVGSRTLAWLDRCTGYMTQKALVYLSDMG